MGTRSTFTKGPAAMLQSVAPGRGGGATYATPPNGQRTIWLAWPPTDRHARACPNSCMVTMQNRAKYSKTGQTFELYRFMPNWIWINAMTNHDQCRNTSIP